jgi:hypothetical protein
MSEGRAAVLRQALIGTCALLAIVLLASFYSIVNSAVERAAQRRLASGAPMPAASVQRDHARDPALLARVGN